MVDGFLKTQTGEMKKQAAMTYFRCIESCLLLSCRVCAVTEAVLNRK